jgi:cell division septum initiation protein DivIVA
MSVTRIGFLDSEMDDELHPQFSRVLKGLDAEEVEAYIGQISSRMQSLEQALEEMREQRDAAQRRYATVKDEAYRQAAARMADVLRAADQQADKIRRESEDDRTRRVADAIQQAEQLRREAEADVHRMRQEAEQSLRMAQDESERLLGGLAARRETMISDMLVLKDRLAVLMEQLESTISLSHAQGLVDMSASHPAEPAPIAGAAEDSTRDDLLGLPEGFDLVLPDILPVDRQEE